MLLQVELLFPHCSDIMANFDGAIGIDLGTTYSCVGVWQNERVEIIANDQASSTIHASISLDSPFTGQQDNTLLRGLQ